ncbi:MAG: alpha/beta hydrolase, partial [Calditrichia bacterium]
MEKEEIEPVEYVYNTVDSTSLKAFVFSPQIECDTTRLPAIVIFHGGGWAIGEPSWAFARARHFASKGMIAVAGQYRLSNQRDITPIDAMRDARTIIRWMRRNADSLHIDQNSIVAYG